MNLFPRQLKTLLFAVIACICATMQAGVTIPTFNLENIRVQAFLKEVNYKPGDGSKVGNYNINPPARRDQPAAVSLSWKAVSGAKSLRVYVSTTAKYANPMVIELKSYEVGCDIYNLIPGRTYYYKVVAVDGEGNETIVTEASFATEGSLRMIKADTGYNIRDLGGWNTRSGKKIRYGMIYRGAELSGEYQLNSGDSAIMHDLGIRAELDLRGNTEADNITASRLGPDVDYKRIPTVTYYIEGLKAANPRFADQMNYIFECVKNNKPVFFHCHIGADRTGSLGFLLEGLLGVSESDIYKEYELTTFSALDTPRGKGQIDDMMAYIKTFAGASLEEQFFTYCTQELKLKAADIMDFKSAMLQYTFISTMDFGGDTITVEAGESLKLDPEVTPERASKLGITYVSSDPMVATVTSKGTVSAVRGGFTVVTAKSNVITKDVVIRVPYIESEMPEFVTADGMDYTIIGPNLIENGSFEYAHPLTHWTTGIGSNAEETGYKICEGSQWGTRYLQSLYDADDESSRSIRSLWPIEKDKSYVIGYRVKTANGQTVSNNPHLRVGLLNLGGSGFNGTGDDFIWDDDGAPSAQYGQLIVGADDDDYVFPFPTYGANWAEVQYVFTNTQGYSHCQVWFSHLSKDGIHTCLDNFYLAEVGDGEPTGINEVRNEELEIRNSQTSNLKPQILYDLQGRRISAPKGIYIQNKKLHKAH